MFWGEEHDRPDGFGSWGNERFECWILLGGVRGISFRARMVSSK